MKESRHLLERMKSDSTSDFDLLALVKETAYRAWDASSSNNMHASSTARIMPLKFLWVAYQSLYEGKATQGCQRTVRGANLR